MAALAASLDGVETDDIEDGECTDARRRLTAATAEARRLQSSSVSVEFTITVQAAVLGATSGDDAAGAIDEALSDAVDSGALSSNIANELDAAGIASSISATSASAVMVVPPSSSPSWWHDHGTDGEEDSATNAIMFFILAIGAIVLCFCSLFVITGMFYVQKCCCFAPTRQQVAPQVAVAHAVPMPPQAGMPQEVMLQPQALQPQVFKPQAAPQLTQMTMMPGQQVPQGAPVSIQLVPQQRAL